MNRLDCAARASAITFAAIIFLCIGGGPAAARSSHPHRGHHHARAVPVPTPRPDFATPASGEDSALLKLPDPILSIISEDVVANGDEPAIVRPTRRIYCVEFARLRSGIEIYGDAKTWWARARGEYAESAEPTPGAVMVFAGRKDMRRGHLAVVTRIVSPREIRVDHANWGRDGKIYLNAPVVDVSAANDWSAVRVWNTRYGQMGSRTYAIRGFVSFRGTASLTTRKIALN
jgi:surface antigen